MPKIEDLKNSKPIKETCASILNVYQKSCEKFLGSPGEEGVKRKAAFITLIAGISENHKPRDVFLSLCQFYQNYYCRSSRLIIDLEYYLADLAGQKIPDLIVGPHGGNSSSIVLARYEFGKYAKKLLKDEFMDNDSYLLMEMR